MKSFDGFRDLVTGEDISPIEVKGNRVDWGSVMVKINGKVYPNATLESITDNYASLSFYSLVYSTMGKFETVMIYHSQVWQFEILEQYKAHDFSASFFA